MAAAATLAVLAVVGPSLAQTSDGGDFSLGRPQVYAGIASATGIHETLDTTAGLLVFGDPFYGNVADGSSEFGSSVQPYGRASTYYPGRAVTKAPGLLCGNGVPPACSLPPYPLTVEAGNEPDVRASTSQVLGGNGAPVELTADLAVAHADRRYVSTEAVVSGFSAAGTARSATASVAFRRRAAELLHGAAAMSSVQATAADTSAVRVEGVTARTRQEFDKLDKALLVVTASSELNGVHLLGDTIGVGSVRTTSTYRIDGRKVKDHKDEVVVSGVTVAGQPATIGSNGISVNGSRQGKPVLDALDAALHQALAAAGAQVSLIDSSPSAARGFDQPCSEGRADGLRFYAEQDLKALPQVGGVYFVNVTLGSACTVAAASAGRVDAVGSGADEGSSLTPGGQGLAGGQTPGATSAPGGNSLDSAIPSLTSPSISGGQTRRTSTRRGGLIGLFEGPLRSAVVGHRMTVLYLSFTLAFVGLTLGARMLTVRSLHSPDASRS